MNEKIKNIIIYILIGCVIIVGLSSFFAGRGSGSRGMETKISDIIRDVEGITEQMAAAVPVLNTAVNDLGTNTEQLGGIAESVEQFKNDVSQRIDGLEESVHGKFGELDETIKRGIELSEESNRRLDAALGAGSEMDEYIDRITGYIESVEGAVQSGPD